MLIYQAAKRVAEMRHLEPDWLETDGGKDIYAGPDPQAETVLNLPALSVSVASPRYLFALKALAWEDRDIDDLKILYNLCGFSSVDEAIDYVDMVYSGRPVEVRVAFVLREIFQNDGFDYDG